MRSIVFPAGGVSFRHAAKRFFFNLQERLTGYKKEKKRFFEKVGYYPDLINPRSFSEKMLWKKLYDRNPLLPVTQDKYMVRNYITKVLGSEKAQEILIPLLFVTDNPGTIPFRDLPGSYIVKPNHGSGWYIVVENNNKTGEEIIDSCRKWLKTPYGYKKHEWAYQKIKPRVIIEELLRDEDGKIPLDFKFFVFHGRCRCLYVLRHESGNKIISFFSPDWRYIPVNCGYEQGPSTIERPYNYEEMLSLAESIGGAFDFVRVDLYSVGKKIYFGELTHYPGSGTYKFEPQSFDFELGRYWKITRRMR